MRARVGAVVLLFCFVGAELELATIPDCDALQPFQYNCDAVEISKTTHAAVGCDESRTVQVSCAVIDGVRCAGNTNITKTLPCRFVKDTRWDTALLLAIFSGVLGFDRFYLGYPFVGIMKFVTLGGFVVGNLVDILLIATQVLTPSDGTDFVIAPDMPVLRRFPVTASTFQQHKTR